jgi:serine protease Do
MAMTKSGSARRRAVAPVVIFCLAGGLGSLAGCGKGNAAVNDGGVAMPPGATSLEPLTPLPTSAPVATMAQPGQLPRGDVDIKSGPLTFSPIVKRADLSVVTITTVGEEVEVSPFGRRKRTHELKGLGTGFIIEKDGVILTNNHVIDSADAITVKLSDDREFVAKIVGRDQSTDLAVLRIDAKDLTPLALGDSDAMDVGDWVVAIGNPFGLSHTVSAGIVSAKGRTRDDVPLDPAGYYDFMQTDASINPGNSGGPLLNLKSEVVGINTAIRGGGAQGIGFAIPMNMVKQLLPALMRDGHVTRSALGVRIRDVRELSPEDRATLKLVDDKGTPMVSGGAVVEYVDPGGPADKAGLAAGDVILAFEQEPISTSAKLRWLASTYGVGRVASLRIARDGKKVDVKVTLGQLPSTATKPKGGLPPGCGPAPH